jgi:transcriptional regulator with XRE-family HTH domain
MMSALIQKFPVVVRQLREEKGWSQEELAERADLNRSYVGEIERGMVTPSLLTVGKLALGLQIKPSSLLARCEPIG